MKHFIQDLSLILIALLLIITGAILEKLGVPNIYILMVYILAFLIGGYHTIIEAIELTIKNKSLNVEVLMILAAIGAFYIGEYQEGAILIFIFGLAHVLEEYATLKSQKSLTGLLKLAPERATRIVDDVEELVKVEDLKIGDKIVVKVGEQIPVDGSILTGSTSIDEQMITGEFLPSDKVVGDLVYAGTINLTSMVYVKVLKDAKETVAQKIVDFVKNAQTEKTKRETLIEKIEKWYVYGVILLALFVMFIVPLFSVWNSAEALTKGIIVLVVASPCALVASITPAVLSSLSNGAKQGILIKGGTPLEKAKYIDTVVFDKTGTITEGLPMVIDYNIYGISEEEFKKAVVSIEKQSNHPLAISIVKYFVDAELVDVTTTEIAGLGIEGTIDGSKYLVGRFDMNSCEKCKVDVQKAIKDGFSIVNVAKEDKMVGFIKLKDTIRADAYDAINKLNNNNVETHMLTGDNYQIALNVKKELNISSFSSDLFPEDKVDIIKKLKAENKNIMMVGDGINDAPALAVSDVGVAMGSATDVSLEVADVVFINNNIDNVNKVINLSKRMGNIVIQNMVFSLLVIFVLLAINLFSNIKITYGVLSHEGSTILVILNSLRLLKVKKEKNED